MPGINTEKEDYKFIGKYVVEESTNNNSGGGGNPITGFSTEPKQDVMINQLGSVNSNIIDIHEYLETKLECYFNLDSSITFPFTLTGASYTELNPFFSESQGGLSVVVNNIDDIITVYNNNLNSIRLLKRSDTSFFILSNTREIEGKEFQIGNVFFNFGAYKSGDILKDNREGSTSWGDDLNLSMILKDFSFSFNLGTPDSGTVSMAANDTLRYIELSFKDGFSSRKDFLPGTLVNLSTLGSQFNRVQNLIEFNSLNTNFDTKISFNSSSLNKLDLIKIILGTRNTNTSTDTDASFTTFELPIDKKSNSDKIQEDLNTLKNLSQEVGVIFDLQQENTLGIKFTPINVYSFSLYFEGTGGTLNGIDIPSNYVFECNPNKSERIINSLEYTVPTSVKGRVLISLYK